MTYKDSKIDYLFVYNENNERELYLTIKGSEDSDLKYAFECFLNKDDVYKLEKIVNSFLTGIDTYGISEQKDAK